MFVNRGIHHKGWTAVTRHSLPWEPGQMPAYDDDVWELYAPDDWTQARDLAAQHPDKLCELQRQFLIEAAKYNVLPLDDRRFERFDADLAGRPTLIRGDRRLLFGGVGRLSENSVVSVKNKTHAVTAQVTIPDGRAQSVIIAQGGEFGGWSLYLKHGRSAYCYNLRWSTPCCCCSPSRCPDGARTRRTAPRAESAGSTFDEQFLDVAKRVEARCRRAATTINSGGECFVQ